MVSLQGASRRVKPQRASELGHALASGGIMVHAKDRVCIGIERDRAAKSLE